MCGLIFPVKHLIISVIAFLFAGDNIEVSLVISTFGLKRQIGSNKSAYAAAQRIRRLRHELENA